MFFQGSRKNKFKSVSRWIGVNSAFMIGGAEILGIDMARWSFFSPMGYTGGPFVDLAQQGAAKIAVMAGSTDAVDQLNAGRLSQAYQQVTPVVPWAGLRAMWRTVDALQDEDWKTAAKRFAGFQPVEE